jgi:hypothetical protein
VVGQSAIFVELGDVQAIVECVALYGRGIDALVELRDDVEAASLPRMLTMDGTSVSAPSRASRRSA